jgi:HD-like signal output (HDOD) protein
LKLEALFQQPQMLPAMPRVVQQLVASLASEAAHSDDLVPLIGSDPVLSAELLRLANSAYFQRSSPVGSVHQALQQLGFVNVRALVIRIGLMTRFVNVPGHLLKPFWQHSVHTAMAARHWAARLDVNPELAYLLGLLHAIGQLLMRIRLPDAMLELDLKMSANDPRRQLLEQQVLGFSTAQVGAELLQRWQFPALFSQVIAGASVSVEPAAQPLAALITLAAWQAWVTDAAPDDAQIEASWPELLAQQVGVLHTQAGRNFPPWDELCSTIDRLTD